MLSCHHDPGCTNHLLLQKWCPGETQAQNTAITPAKLRDNFKHCWISNSSLLPSHPLCCLDPVNDRGCLLLCPHESEASDRDAHPQGDELFCTSACLLMDFQKPVRAAGVWALRKQVSLPELVSTPCLPRQFSRGSLCPWGSAALPSGTCECDCARFGDPALPLLVAVLPCYFSPTLLGLEAPSSSALFFERSKPMATLVQAEELPSNST